MNKRWILAVLAGFALLAAACGSDDGATGAEPSDGSTNSDADSAGVDDAEDAAVDDATADIDDLVDNLEDVQASQGGGSATLVVGDQEWNFGSVLCAFGEEQIGQEGAVFNLSSIQDGLQMYASIDSFGHSLSLDDIEDFENPSVSLSTFGDTSISLDGKSITGEGEFMDGTSDSFETIPGTFTATCP